MRLEDRRPAFAGLANLTEQQLQSLPTPCYLLDEAQLRRNGQIMLELQQRTGCRALLAQKAFSNFDVYPVLAPYLAGTGQTSSRSCCSTPTTSCSTPPAS